MKTDELVNLLAAGEGAADTKRPARRFGLAIGSGVLGAMALMVVSGVHADLTLDLAESAMFWLKLAFAALLAAGGVLAALRLSRPGVSLAWLPGALAAPVLAVWALAAFVLIDAEPTTRSGLVFGRTWAVCLLSIALLSIPGFIAHLWAMKGLAPTRLRLAGAAAGFASGALGALVFALRCPELAAPFLGIWYVMGMLIPTAVGALIGPRALRW